MTDTALPRPYLLFLGDAADQLSAKTGHGIAHWRPEWCAGQFRLPGCAADIDLDGPLVLARDRKPGLVFEGSTIHPPGPALWG